jgi:hypothetical protein
MKKSIHIIYTNAHPEGISLLGSHRMPALKIDS